MASWLSVKTQTYECILKVTQNKFHRLHAGFIAFLFKLCFAENKRTEVETSEFSSPLLNFGTGVYLILPWNYNPVMGWNQSTERWRITCFHSKPFHTELTRWTHTLLQLSTVRDARLCCSCDQQNLLHWVDSMCGAAAMQKFHFNWQLRYLVCMIPWLNTHLFAVCSRKTYMSFFW